MLSVFPFSGNSHKEVQCDEKTVGVSPLPQFAIMTSYTLRRCCHRLQNWMIHHVEHACGNACGNDCGPGWQSGNERHGTMHTYIFLYTPYIHNSLFIRPSLSYQFLFIHRDSHHINNLSPRVDTHTAQFSNRL